MAVPLLIVVQLCPLCSFYASVAHCVPIVLILCRRSSLCSTVPIMLKIMVHSLNNGPVPVSDMSIWLVFRTTPVWTLAGSRYFVNPFLTARSGSTHLCNVHWYFHGVAIFVLCDNSQIFYPQNLQPMGLRVICYIRLSSSYYIIHDDPWLALWNLEPWKVKFTHGSSLLYGISCWGAYMYFPPVCV